MSLWNRTRSVRVSLTLWYIAAMVVILAVYAAGVVTFVGRSMSRGLDERLRGDLQWAAEMWQQRPDGTLTWFESDDCGREETPWLQVWHPRGDLLFQTSCAAHRPLPAGFQLATQTGDTIVSISEDRATYRVLSHRSTLGATPVVLQVARSEGPMRQDVRDLALILVLGLPVGVAAAGLGGYWLARIALRPVDRMAERARSITTQRLSDRLPVANPNDELGRLAAVFNDTLGRLESSFEQMRQFTADVSHELRTPLAALRGVGEVGLREPRDAAAYRAIIGSMLEEVDRLTLFVERLLTLSRADAGQTASFEPIDLRDLADEVVAQLGVLAEEKQQSLTVVPEGRPSCVGDREILRQALINLVDNAIKFSPAGASIRIRAAATPAGATMDVSDTGPGVPEDRRERIFDRFYRGSTARDGGGTGLGLAIAKWAIEVNRGHLTLEPGGQTGSTFRITLPAAG